jgi:hypothetical protein
MKSSSGLQETAANQAEEELAEGRDVTLLESTLDDSAFLGPVRTLPGFTICGHGPKQSL